MSTAGYSTTDVLTVARIHPYYNSDVQYPSSREKIQAAREKAAEDPKGYDLTAQPLLWKTPLYEVIERLVNDKSPENTFRQGIYISTTGGGSGGRPLLFATDVHENRRQRAAFGRFLQTVGLIDDNDLVITTHFTGHLYRSLDLILEILENAGASVLAAGQHMTPAEVVKLMTNFNANVLSGDSSQVIQIVHHISTLPQEQRDSLRINKIIYTSEGLSKSQRLHILEVFGPIQICSILGSAEAGPYAVSCPRSEENRTVTSYEDFVFDTRMMMIEIFPASITEGDALVKPLEEGHQGAIVQTSLARLRNPLIRYVTGDVGSLHPLPAEMCAQIPKDEQKFFQVLRLQGRDRRFSFDWDGNYFEFNRLNQFMADPKMGILQWQVILSKLEESLEAALEIRLLHTVIDESVNGVDVLAELLEEFFYVYQGNRYRFTITFVENLDGFERSSTGRKVIRFVDKLDQATNGST
ncbi:hypothetical protein FDECE_13045 [Fusarium decemcellulare]|nr:hypothetical protein FDECE_13045 [Fusarium decemcellulare]